MNDKKLTGKDILELIENDILPNALMIGIDYDLFWTLNPKSLKPFVKAFQLKQKYDDTVAWQTGQYIQLAIGSCLSDKVKYPKSPFMSGDTDIKKVETPKVMSAEEIKNKMLERMKLLNARFGEGE